jgi:GNAT superfamily N-acetyltransferase
MLFVPDRAADERASVAEWMRLVDGTAVRLLAAPDRRPDSGAGDGASLAAEDRDGRVVGRVSYRRLYGPRAALTLEVDEAFWHRGLPRVLLTDACEAAAACGISTFLVRVRASDVRLLALLREEFAARESRDGDFADVELATAPRLIVASP